MASVTAVVLRILTLGMDRLQSAGLGKMTRKTSCCPCSGYPPPSTPCCPTAFLALTWDDIELPQLTTVGCAGREKGGSGRAGSGPAVCSPDEEEPCRRDPGRTSLTARLCLRLSDSVGVGVVCYVVPRCCGRGRVLNSRHRGKCCVKRQL